MTTTSRLWVKRWLLILSLMIWRIVLSPAKADSPVRYITWSSENLNEIKKRQKMVEVRDGFFEMESKSYHISTQVDAKFTAACSLYMDFLYQELQKTFKAEVTVNIKPTVVIYSSLQAYQAALQSDTQSRGYYSYQYENGGKKWPKFHLYSYIAQPHETDFEYFYIPILNHEGTHQILRMQAGIKTIPLFLNEAFATYFQYYRFDDKEDRLKKRKRRSEFLPALKMGLKQGLVPTLRELIAIQDPWAIDNFGPATELRYASAEAFAAFLIESTAGKNYLKTFYKAIFNGDDADKLFDDKAWSKMDVTWRSFLKSYLD